MKRFLLTLCLVAALPVSAGAAFFEDENAPPVIPAAGATFEVVFSSPKGLSPAIAAELAGAKKSIRVAARNFVSKPVSEALVDAARKGGVDLKVVLNKKTNTSMMSAAQFMFKLHQIPRLTKNADGLHAAYIVVDGQDVILGNVAGFADEEEEKQNAGYALIIRNAPDLAKQYLANWQTLWDNSEEMKEEKD